jgi:tagatose 6-phosphate kinase
LADDWQRRDARRGEGQQVILVVGLSPAWQRTLLFHRLVPGKVNRTARISETASGKGVNVARVASILGAKVKLLTVAGGERGQLLKAELKQQKLSAHVVSVKTETRICQTLLSPGTTTELVEEANPLTPAEVKEVVRAFTLEVRKADLVVLTGTVPKGCGDDFYARLIAESTRHGVRVLIDTQKTQLRNALKRSSFLVRINRDELTAATDQEGVTSGLRKLLKAGPQWGVISDGARSIHVGEAPGDQASSFTSPRVKTKNPIGSGDAMLAGIAVGLERGLSVPDAVRFGAACGAANAMTAEPGFVRIGDVRRLCSTLNKRLFIV